MGGVCSARHINKQVLLCGLDGAGKTTLLYSYVLSNMKDFQAEPTIGFNFEVIKEKDAIIGFWDVIQSFNVKIKILIFYY